jgi:hypothetical protein
MTTPYTTPYIIGSIHLVEKTSVSSITIQMKRDRTPHLALPPRSGVPGYFTVSVVLSHCVDILGRPKL